MLLYEKGRFLKMSAYLYLLLFIMIFVVVVVVSAVITFKMIKSGLGEKIKLDITTEDMKSSERRIKDFFRKNNLQAGESIFEIARILNVEQGGIERGLQSQAYLKECDDQKKIVVFNSELSEKERYFVFAHEIAHLINGDSIPAARPSGRNKAKIEQLADYTAAALLMPEDAIYNYLKNSNYKQISIKKRAMIVNELCEKYNVTEIIALRRIKEVYVLKQS